MARFINQIAIRAAQLFIVSVFSAALCGAVIAQDFDKSALNIDLTNQDGESVNLYSDLIESRTAVIYVCYTTNTTICPPLMVSSAKLEQRLAKEKTDASLILISVDPSVDTPQRLKGYAALFDFKGTLVTGEKPVIDRLLKSLSVFTADLSELAPVVLIGNEQAKSWVRMNGFTKTEVLIDEIRKTSAASP